MKMALVILVIGLVVWLGYAYIAKAGGPGLTIAENEVLLTTAHLDVRFAQAGEFHEIYMLFGGTYVDQQDAVNSVTLAGLPGGDVKRIAARHPDFYMCSSEGAPLAKRKVRQLDLVPADKRTLKALKSALKDFDHNVRNDGDRVCVDLAGQELDLESVEVRDAGESITHLYGRNHFYLVTAADVVDCQEGI